MSNKNHNREAAGRVPKRRRMPSRDIIKLGTQWHENTEEKSCEFDVQRCQICTGYFELYELNSSYICIECEGFNE